MNFSSHRNQSRKFPFSSVPKHYPSRQPRDRVLNYRKSTGGAPRIERTERKRVPKIIPSRYSDKDLKDMPIQDAAKVLRVDLRQMFGNAPFSVRIEQYSGGESINLSWVDGPSTESVEDLLTKYKRENWRYVHGSHHYTPEAWHSVEEAIKKERPSYNEYDNEDHMGFYRKLASTSFPPKPLNTRPTM